MIAADFFLMSNPLVFVAGMDRALTLAAIITGSALVLTFPWVKAPRVAWPILLFLSWLLLSYLWSIQPSFTAAAWAQTTIVAAVAAAICANVSARVLVAGVVTGGVVVSAASVYAFRAELPGAQYETVLGPAMAGVGTNLNILAYTLSLSLCAVCAVLPRRIWSRVAWLGALVVIGYSLVEAGSATGDLTAAVILASSVLLAVWGPVTRRCIRTTSHRLIALVVLAAGAAAAYVGITRLLGHDLLTFSGRTPLWSAALTVAQERPVGGFGFGAVWQHPWKPPLLNIVIGEIWDRSGTALSHGHNSAVDLVVEVGVVGVLLMVLIMGTAALRCVRLLRSTGSDDSSGVVARFIALCLVALVLCGVTEPMATIPLGWWTLVLLMQIQPDSEASR